MSKSGLCRCTCIEKWETYLDKKKNTSISQGIFVYFYIHLYEQIHKQNNRNIHIVLYIIYGPTAYKRTEEYIYMSHLNTHGDLLDPIRTILVDNTNMIASSICKKG